MTDIDDFEFRPLTEGLGFQKKTNQPSEATDKAFQSLRSSESSSTGSLHSSLFDLDSSRSSSPSSTGFSKSPSASSLSGEHHLHSFFGPDVDTPARSPQDSPSPHPDTAVDDILRTLKKNNLDFFNEDQKKSHAFPKSPGPQWTMSTNSLMALFLDGLLILAICLTAMILLILVVDVDLMGVLRATNDWSLVASHISIFAGFSIIYLLSSRCYLGATPGEWAFDQQLGNPAEQKTPIYPLKVFVRSILVVFSGFLIFPFLSWVLGYDVAGKISDVRLMERRK